MEEDRGEEGEDWKPEWRERKGKKIIYVNFIQSHTQTIFPPIFVKYCLLCYQLREYQASLDCTLQLYFICLAHTQERGEGRREKGKEKRKREERGERKRF